MFPPCRQYIQHPRTVPVRYRRCENGAGVDLEPASNLIGLCFECTESIEPGTALQLTIPLMNGQHRLNGFVAWSCRRGGAYRTAVRFATETEAFEARALEQLCHIEAYRKRIREKQGRRLTRERAAWEWIGRYAARFPAG